MKRWLNLAFLLVLALVPRVSFASFAVVQNNSNFGSGTTVTTAFNSNTTAGNAIIVHCFYAASAENCNTVPTDTLGNTYVADHAAVVLNNAGEIVFHVFNIAGGADSVSCHLSAGSSARCTVVEVSGINAIDQTAVGTGHSQAPVTAATGTTTLAAEFLFGAVAVDPAGGATFVPASGYTTIDGSSNVGYEEYKIVAATGTYTAGASWSDAAQDWVAQISTYYNTNPVISPTTPLVNPGGTVQINCTISCGSGGTFTCGAGCLGSISGAGLYTAPATLAANQSLGGWQLHPPDHIFNTNISATALRSDSATLMTQVGAVALSLEPSFPFMYVDGTTPTTTLTFDTSSVNNGVYKLPLWPSLELESGVFDAFVNNTNNDHHGITVDTTNGNMQEIYQYYAQAPITGCTINGASNSATCTITPSPSSIGFQRAAVLGRNVQIGSFTGGDTFFNGVFALTAATTTTITFNITHGAAVSSTTGQAALGNAGVVCGPLGTCNSNSGIKYTYADYALPAGISADAAGLELAPLTLRSQEFVNALVNGVPIKHALRMTLQNGLICGSSLANACAGNAFGTRHIWPATAEAFLGGGVIPYGMRFRLKAAYNISGYSAAAQVILTACKNYGLIVSDGGTSWAIVTDADNLPATEAAAIQEIFLANIANSNFEVVDESGLMESTTSGAANNGEVITYTSSTGTATTHIDLQGTALNVNTNQYYIMAGTPQQQLVFWANNGGTATCAMSPTVGSITSDCKYTAPGSVGTETTTTVTFTSSTNAAVKQQMIIYVYPAANFNLLTSNTSNFTDSHSVVWYAGKLKGTSNHLATTGCCQGSHEGSFAQVDKQLFYDLGRNEFDGNPQDYKFDFHVPVGTYRVTFNNGSFFGTGDTRYMYAQGVQAYAGDWNVTSGGQYKLGTFSTTAVVGSNNTFSFAVAGQGLGTDGDVSSISIVQTAAAGPAGVSRGRLP